MEAKQHQLIKTNRKRLNIILNATHNKAQQSNSDVKVIDRDNGLLI